MKSFQGRGRLFIREALQHRLLVNTIELLVDSPNSLLTVSAASFCLFVVLQFMQGLPDFLEVMSPNTGEK